MRKHAEPTAGNQADLLTAKNGHRSITQTPRRKNRKSSRGNKGRAHTRKGRRR